ncbi:unnamed protein product [Eretmochelys imbricata]
MDPAGDGAEFHIPTVGRQHGGSYGCSYRPRSEPFISSQPSDPVQLVGPCVSRRDARSYSCGYSTKSDPPVWSEPSDPEELVVPGGSEPSAAPDLTRRIMAGVSAAAAGLLLLLLAFLCYRSTQGNTLIGEGKELDVLPQEPDPDYAEVDTQVL